MTGALPEPPNELHSIGFDAVEMRRHSSEERARWIGAVNPSTVRPIREPM